ILRPVRGAGHSRGPRKGPPGPHRPPDSPGNPATTALARRALRGAAMRKRTSKRILSGVGGVAAALTMTTGARAATLNDPGCKPPPGKNPVVVVHGQGGNFEGMGALTSSLGAAGYCVYAKNYGRPPGGNFGQEHLATSAAEI